jgi:anti-sigma regulatory factor (Ser/Thr protein kinase)
MPATTGADDPAGGAPQPAPGSTPAMRWRRVFPGEERQLGLLRRWLASLFPPCPARDDVAVIANELASNAIRHTGSGRGGCFAVEVTWDGPVVRVAVADSGTPAEPRVIEDPAREHGRGLLVVRELSVDMGVCGDGRGRLMWADIRWDASPVDTPVAPDGCEAAIRDGQATLARSFAGVTAWFGRSTLAWWALAHPGRLVSAPTAHELAGLLYRLRDAADPSESPATGHVHNSSADERPAPRSPEQPGAGGQDAAHGRCPGTAGTSLGGSGLGHPKRTRRPALVPGLMAAWVASPARA